MILTPDTVSVSSAGFPDENVPFAGNRKNGQCLQINFKCMCVFVVFPGHTYICFVLGFAFNFNLRS